VVREMADIDLEGKKFYWSGTWERTRRRREGKQKTAREVVSLQVLRGRVVGIIVGWDTTEKNLSLRRQSE